MKKRKSLAQFTKEFEDGTLPKEEWDHLGHLRVALYYVVKERSLPKAISKIRAGIIRYNCLQPKNLCSERYNETATVFWTNELHAYAQGAHTENLDELAEKIETSPLSDPRYIFQFYSKDELSSDEYKALFHLPRN